MQAQVAGFLFDKDCLNVALILKNRPDYLADKWNGIGGKVMDGETVHDAMRREFREEAGLDVLGWRRFAIHQTKNNTEISWFVAQVERSKLAEVESMTDEPVEIFCTGILPPNIVHNLHFLIPMAIDYLLCRSPGYEIVERTV